MSALRDIQRAVQASVVAHAPDDAHTLIEDGSGASARERLHVYIHAYPARLAEALRNDFIGLRALVGDDRFDEIARAYVDAHRSTHANVRWFGAGLADFLGQTIEGDMARLDWAIGLAFDAPDDVPVALQTFAELSADAWPGLRFTLSRSLVRCSFASNVGELRRALDRGESLPAGAHRSAPTSWFVSRVDGTVYHRAAADDEAAAIGVIEQNGTFAELCAQLAAWHADDAIPARALSLLQNWVAAGWITHIETASPRD